MIVVPAIDSPRTVGLEIHRSAKLEPVTAPVVPVLIVPVPTDRLMLGYCVDGHRLLPGVAHGLHVKILDSRTGNVKLLDSGRVVR